MRPFVFSSCCFFFNDTATTEIYTLSLHDALPIWSGRPRARCRPSGRPRSATASWPRSEEHTSELQSPKALVCRLLLEKKKQLSPYPRRPGLQSTGVRHEVADVVL